MTQRSWRWNWLPDQGSGSELFEHEATSSGHALRGRIVASQDGAGIEASYVVETDTAWRTRRVRVEIANRDRALEISANGIGRWSDAGGTWIPALDGCIDVDLSLTPATNTLPIRRLGLPVGEGADIKVAYVLAPDLSLRAGPQRYTRLGDRFWRFRGVDIDFTADISVDEEGFVVDYPGLFQRI
ncbi:MAG TPA: putative glycolipid-binding domain-containing protein [Dongiaceae bacterium]|nr:putative glycolipid-binding domain-containing protein [Dongiaceae bacterium]